MAERNHRRWPLQGGLLGVAALCLVVGATWLSASRGVGSSLLSADKADQANTFMVLPPPVGGVTSGLGGWLGQRLSSRESCSQLAVRCRHEFLQ